MTDFSTPVVETADSAATDPVLRKIRFVFHGRAGEYFRIWIVNIVLTILTLGIYSAWAKVRTNRYFYGSTVLDGRPFDYTADPLGILKGRLIAGGVFLVWYLLSTLFPLLSLILLLPLMAATPWVVVRSLKFRAYHTRHRSLRFSFHGQYADAALAYVLYPLVAVFTIGLFWPYAAYARAQYTMNNLGYGNLRFSFDGKPGGYYAIWLGLLGYMIVFGLVLIMVIDALPLGDGSGEMTIVEIVFAGITYAAVIFGIYVFPPAFIRARQGNYLADHSSTDRFRASSNMKVEEVLQIYATNLVAIVFTLGLAIPWAQIRTARYRLEHTSLVVSGDLDSIAAGDRVGVSATGEELGDVFDLDIGL